MSARKSPSLGSEEIDGHAMSVETSQDILLWPVRGEANMWPQIGSVANDCLEDRTSGF